MSQSPTRPDVVFVEDKRGLAAAVQAIGQAPVVGFDTEFVGESTYEPQLCLLQVSTPERILLVDPLSRIDLREFWLVLTAPGREVVSFCAREELLFCLRYAARLPGSLFDPQVAAGLVGFGYPLSHTNFVRRVLNIDLEPSETYTDWLRRPLSEQQLRYAAADVRHLLAARRALIDRAERMGRLGWITSECERLVELVTESQREKRWWRLPGISRLDGRTLAVLRELWRWRENRARAANLPPRRVMGDALLVQIARRSPRDIGGLVALRGMNRGHLRNAGAEIIAAVRAGLSVPEEKLPALVAAVRHDDPPQVAILVQLLTIFVKTIAFELQVDASLLAATSDLQEVVRWHLGSVDDGPPQVLTGWRGEILEPVLVELLEGKRSVRVGDVTSPSPICIDICD
jgi:ribonuclease D